MAYSQSSKGEKDNTREKKHEGVRGLSNFAQTRLGGEFSVRDVITKNSSSRL